MVPQEVERNQQRKLSYFKWKCEILITLSPLFKVVNVFKLEEVISQY